CIFLWYTGDWCIPTMLALGIMLGAEEKAKAYMDYSLNVINIINERLKDTKRPYVIVAGGSKSLAEDGVSSTVTVYSNPMEGDYYFTNLVANAYTNSSGLSEFGSKKLSYEWMLLNDNLLDYILIYQNQTGFATGSADSGVIITQQEFNERFESTVGTYKEMSAYKNGHYIGIPYDMFGGISGYGLTLMIAYMIYPDLFTLNEAQDMLQKWFDEFTVAKLDVRKTGGYYYSGGSYPAALPLKTMGGTPLPTFTIHMANRFITEAVDAWVADDVDFSEEMTEYRHNTMLKELFIAICVIAAFLVAGWTLTIGDYPIGFFHSYEVLWNHLTGSITDSTEDFIIWRVRTPRIFTGLLAGFGLAVCGAVMQSILKNPLADAYTTGVSSGASFGATLAIALGVSIAGAGGYALVANAFVFSLIPVLVIVTVAKMRARPPPP
ncbi:MAG: iron chelate uptake ABC transporter family permease subunit, partial [Candidatus Methanomethylophilaceae archaeon]|nr:iron chelate uptake ABC transporter family permease subunit [Candidatus Methanomethylophilaceae archaeon]